MKILCQERYDKAVAYAKEIKNDTLQKCIDRLKQWEENPNCPCEIELYYDLSLIHISEPTRPY